MGYEKEQVLVFADHLGPWELSLDGEAAEVFLPIERDLFRNAGVVFLCLEDEEARTLISGWAREEGTLVMDLRCPPSRDSLVVDPLLAPPLREGEFQEVFLPDPEAMCCARALRAVGAAEIISVTVHALHPASQRGEEGVKALFQQTAALMSFQEVPQEVFGRQLAFSLVPEDDPGRGGRIEAQMRALCDEMPQLQRVGLLVSVFHGSALSLVLEVEDAEVSDQALRNGAAAKWGFEWVVEDRWPSPTDIGGKGGVLMKTRVLGPRTLWMWILFDEIQSGRAAAAASLLGLWSETAIPQ
jgi:aspartate-semialdehyde dehydrogenase